MHRPFEWIISAAAIVVVISLGVMAYHGGRGRGAGDAGAVPELSTAYHAVALTNGQVFFGHIQSLGGEYTVLQDVFYIQSWQNPDTKQVANVLIAIGAAP
jgi:hypothetical protein